MKKMALIKMDTNLPKTGEHVKFYLIADSDLLKTLPQDQLKNNIDCMIKEVMVELPMATKNINTSYTFVDDVEKSDFGNTIIEVHLPYCLHIPNKIGLDVYIPERDLMAQVFCRKIWTNKAIDSSETDIYAEDRTIYFNKGEIITPQFPIDPIIGWRPCFTGKNVENIKEEDGYFRFTKLQIFLKTNYSKEQLESNDGLEKINMEIREITFQIVNYLLDVYRYISEEEFVERLGSLIITNIYFYDYNIGFYPATMEIQSAIMNHSKQKIKSIKNILESGNKPPIYELLLLSADASFNKKMFILAIVSSFQGLEIYLEKFLISKYKQKNISDEEIENKLNLTWRTKERLKKLLEEETGHSLIRENKELWDKWCVKYDKVRNEVIHKNKEMNQEETEQTLKINCDIISWIKSIENN